MIFSFIVTICNTPFRIKSKINDRRINMSTLFQSRTIISTLVWIIACLALGSLAGILSNSGNTEWYQLLNRPKFAPPSWVFGPVWTVLYIMIGCAASYLWLHRDQQPLVFIMFIAQLILNYAWSFIFFRMHALGFAVFEIFILLISIITIMILSFSQHRIVTWLLLPYACWVGFASILSTAFWLNNL